MMFLVSNWKGFQRTKVWLIWMSYANVSLKDDPKPADEHDIKVVDILEINM